MDARGRAHVGRRQGVARQDQARGRKWAKRALLAAAETGHDGWYEWSVANWGTKWDAYSTRDIVRTGNRLTFRFETAWSFPLPVFKKLAEMYPELTIVTASCDEGGPCYRGSFAGGKSDLRKVTETHDILHEVYGEGHWRLEEEEDEEEEGGPRVH